MNRTGNQPFEPLESVNSFGSPNRGRGPHSVGTDLTPSTSNHLRILFWHLLKVLSAGGFCAQGAPGLMQTEEAQRGVDPLRPSLLLLLLYVGGWGGGVGDMGWGAVEGLSRVQWM